MHLKFFQPVADIHNHYQDILMNFENEKYGKLLLETWNIFPSDKEAIIEEAEAIRYLMSCRLEMAHRTNVKKPTIEIMNRCLTRHLAFLETIHGCHTDTVNKHHSSLIQKQYKACRHYLFKFSLPAWYEKLPEEILTFENKHPNFRKELIE